MEKVMDSKLDLRKAEEALKDIMQTVFIREEKIFMSVGFIIFLIKIKFLILEYKLPNRFYKRFIKQKLGIAIAQKKSTKTARKVIIQQILNLEI